MKVCIVFIKISALVGFCKLLNYAYYKGKSTGRNLGYIEGYLKCVADGKSEEESK